MSHAPFVIFALPRSRTAWLAQFLTYRSVSCAHEQLRHIRSLDDVKTWLSQEDTGCAETAAAPWWRLLSHYRPDAKIVVIRRPVEDVVESLMRLDLHGAGAFDRHVLTATIKRLDAKLDQIEKRAPNVLSVRFADLEQEETCAAVFTHCLPYAYDGQHWRRLKDVNIQCSMPGLMRYCAAYKAPMDKMAASAKQACLAVLAQRKFKEPDGFTIQEEPFDTFVADGAKIFAEHSLAVDEKPDSYLTKNIPLMRRLAELGNLQVITARSNGRMFGYLMAILSPSLEHRDLRMAVHTAFFVSRDAPPLGLKLQRASIEALKKKNVEEIWFRAGTRGSGPKVETLYRRLGAEEDGKMFRLNLRAA